MAEADARHQQLVKDLNIHPVYQDAPAPPLVWPEWLVHHKGSKLAARPGVDPAGHDYLKSTFVTSTPMTAVYAFYEDLLKAHGTACTAVKLATGQTISGVVQNANGYVEGTNYPNGHPGPYTVIRVSFHRFQLNDPITVEVKFTTYAFQSATAVWPLSSALRLSCGVLALAKRPPCRRGWSAYPGASVSTNRHTGPGGIDLRNRGARRRRDRALPETVRNRGTRVSIPISMASGTSIRGTAREGDLLILIRRQGGRTAVRVDLTANPLH